MFQKLCHFFPETLQIQTNAYICSVFISTVYGKSLYTLKYLVFPICSQQSNEVNEKLLKAINDDRRIHMVPSIIRGVYFLRFAICASSTTSDDVVYAWKVIQEITAKVVQDMANS